MNSNPLWPGRPSAGKKRGVAFSNSCMFRRCRGRWLVAACSAARVLMSSGRPADFSKEIQPLFAERCYSCHGEKKQESGLRLDSRDVALQGGDHGPLVAPGKSADSLLIQVVTGKHKELKRMPGKGDPLTEEQVSLLAQWIDAAANWPVAAANDPK